MKQKPLLIVGAGPTGLVLALWLTRLGISVRIIDKETKAGTTSRALVLHARTLEFYAQVGLSSKIVERSLKFSSANLWAKGKKMAHIQLGEMGKGLSPFPYMMIFPQDEHENFLIEELKSLGVQVERGIQFIGFEQSQQNVQAKLKHPDGHEEIFETSYLAGCDGARSEVRKALRMNFGGSTYAQLFYVADVQVDGVGNDKELHVSLDEADFLAIFPLKQPGHARLIGVITPEAEKRNRDITWDDVKSDALARLDLQVREVKWFSTYHVHHRLAENFRQNRVFLLGDAAHIHSPVGGQGMNTGIGDAVNLAWKLAAVLKKEAHEKILDSYSQERMAFAKRLVSTTDRAFTFVSSTGAFARLVRLKIAPPMLAFVTKFKFVRRFLFKTISQISIHYEFSSLSWSLGVGEVGKIKAGDRLPWTKEQSGALPIVWNIRVYGQVSHELKEFCKSHALQLNIFPWNKSLKRSGFKQDALYLIRPDGYIGFADAEARAENIQKYFENRIGE